MAITKGPWTYTHIYDGAEVVCGGEDGLDYVGTCKHDADARLIVCAPDLLKELEQALNYFNSGEDDVCREYAVEIRKLIAKAKGEL